MKLPPLRLLLVLLACCLAALPTSGTWSIVVINTRTGEIGVASATCLEDFNLKSGVPVIVVGKGAAAAQSFLDTGGVNRKLIRNLLRDTDDTPQEILDAVLAADPGFRTRQYGISAFTGPSVTFTGTMAGKARPNVAGSIGDYRYAIQGNLLTADEVVFAAEMTFRNTPGDMGQKIMAVMETARSLGGDGRCSCPGPPTSCGTQPPQPFKSAHVGFFVLARLGDSDGVCNGLRGCANGTYYASLNVRGDADDPDPVFTLQERYDDWRAARRGRPDGLLSTVDAVDSLPADGATERTVTIALVDLDGSPLVTGGALIEVTTESGAPSLATVGPVVDHGDGTYSFTLKAGTTPGTDRFVITAEDDFLTATLAPYLEVRSEAATALHAGLDEISAAAGGTIPLVVNEPTLPNGRYAILGSLSGTTPGFALGDVLLPLRLDDFLPFTVAHANDPAIFPGTTGLLDDRGRAEAAVIVPPGGILPLAGRTMYWASAVVGSKGLVTSDPVSVSILP